MALRGKLPSWGVGNPRKSRSKSFRDGRKWPTSPTSQSPWHLSRRPYFPLMVGTEPPHFDKVPGFREYKELSRISNTGNIDD